MNKPRMNPNIQIRTLAHAKTRSAVVAAGMATTLTAAVLVLAGMAVPRAAQAQERGRVISSTPVMMPVAVPREVCTDRSVSEGSRSSGAGALIGGIAGGAAGNAIGNGSGRAAATAIGIIGGAMLGNQIEGGGQTQNRLVRECGTQTVYENRATAFDVVYEYAGQRYSVRMAEDPGEFVQLQLNPVGALQEPSPDATAQQYTPQYSQPYSSNPYPQQYAPQYAPQYVAPQYVAPQYAVPQYISPPITRIIVTPNHYYTPPPRVIYVPSQHDRPDRHRDGRRDDRQYDRRDDRRDGRRDDRREDRRLEQQQQQQQQRLQQGNREERRVAPPIPIGRPLNRSPGNTPYPSDL